MSRYAMVSPQDVILERRVYPDDAPPEIDLETIAASKPRVVPIEVVGFEPFDAASQVRTGPVETVEAARVLETYTVADKTGAALAALRTAKTDAVKAEASRRILLIMPEVQQRNALAAGLAFVLEFGLDYTTWPGPAQVRLSQTLTAWAQIQAIRTRSDELEAAIPETAAEAAAFDPTDGWD